MRIAVYGGSFNPPHVAHAMVATWLLWTDQVDEVWLVPVFRHAFEDLHDKKLAPYSKRLDWCRAFANDINPKIKVSDVESKLPPPSYSVDTLKYLSDLYSQHQFHLVIGADVIPDLPKWRDWKTIEELFSPIIVGRVGYPCPPGAVEFPPVSSSEIRKAAQGSKILRHFLSKSVADSLAQENPYLKGE